MDKLLSEPYSYYDGNISLSMPYHLILLRGVVKAKSMDKARNYLEKIRHQISPTMSMEEISKIMKHEIVRKER